MAEPTGIVPVGSRFQAPSANSDDAKKTTDDGLVLNTVLTANAKPTNQMVEDSELQGQGMDEDDIRLATMGYKQEMRRSISLIGIISCKSK